MTTRGMGCRDFEVVADILKEAACLATEVQGFIAKVALEDKGRYGAAAESPIVANHMDRVTLEPFLNELDSQLFSPKVAVLRKRVEALASPFPMPGPQEGGPLP